MTTTITTDLDLLRTRMAGAMTGQLPGHVERLGWSAGQLATFQRDRLRALLARAIECSPFHAERLRGVDPSRFELTDLPRLPVMTKTQMMADFNRATTDRRLTRKLVEQHLAGSAAEPSLLLGEYVCLLSGGSTGLRGLVVQRVSEYADFVASIMRRFMAAAIAAGGPPPEGMVIGIVGAGAPVHSSGLGAALNVGPPVRMIPAPATLPTAEIVRRLNAAQPPVLMAYAAKLAELAREQREGRLRLSLRSVISHSEALSPAERTAVGDAFGVPVIDLFVSTEGLVGHSDPGQPVFTFASDTCLAECTDEAGQPVPPGVASSKVLVTNLHNLTQPIIRYELTDRFTPAGGGDGGFLRASVEGRSDDLFRYAEASVHPFVLGAVLLSAPAIREFQVRQTERGADVAAVIDGNFDQAAVTAALEQSLRQAGLPDPQVWIRRVEALDRDAMTGKARRFIPVHARPAGPPDRRPLGQVAPSAYDYRMRWGTSQPVSGRELASRPLLPGPLRPAAAGLLAACVAVTAVLGVRIVGRGLPGWLDSAFDARIQAALSRFPSLLNWLPDFGTLGPVALMTLALVLACLASGRWTGAVLAAVAVPAAAGLTEYVLKPYVGEPIGQSFPSGHATSMFALAVICAVLLVEPPRRQLPGAVRLLLVILALLLAAAVAAAMVAIGAHNFTDVVGGAAVGTAVVLACALTLDLIASRRPTSSAR